MSDQEIEKDCVRWVAAHFDRWLDPKDKEHCEQALTAFVRKQVEKAVDCGTEWYARLPKGPHLMNAQRFWVRYVNLDGPQDDSDREAVGVLMQMHARIAALEAALTAADHLCEVVRTQDHGQAERERLIAAHDAYLSARAKVKL